MENTIYQNINLIIDSIERQSEREQKALEENSEKLYKEKYEALKKEIKSKYRKQTSYELSKLTLAANKSTSGFEADHKAKLAALRQSIVDEVYKEAFKSIEMFTKSENYVLLLVNSAKKMSAIYDGSVKVYMKKEDAPYKEKIAEAFGKTVSFCEDDTIVLGGIKVLFTNHDVIADDTLDSRLEASKKNFARNSGIGFVN